MTALIAKFMGSTWGPSRADRTQVGPMLAPCTLLSRWSGSIRTYHVLLSGIFMLNTKMGRIYTAPLGFDHALNEPIVARQIIWDWGCLHRERRIENSAWAICRRSHSDKFGGPKFDGQYPCMTYLHRNLLFSCRTGIYWARFWHTRLQRKSTFPVAKNYENEFHHHWTDCNVRMGPLFTVVD